MREILFRGKRIDTGEWIMGSPFIAQDCCKMIVAVALHPDFVDEGNVYYSEGAPVDINTIGQYTGMKDKNGTRIFEGDCINHPYNVVEYLEGGFCVAGDRPLSLMAKYGEVVGNIHDNPELLEVNR